MTYCGSSPEPWPRGSARLFAGAASKIIAVVVLLLFGVYGFYALAPEISYDSLAYHLALPSLYEMEGGLIPTPTNLSSGIPMHMELVYGWAITLSDGILAKLLHWSLGLGLAAGFLGAGARLGKPLAGWLAGAVFFSTPLVGMNLWKTWIDVASSYMVFLSAYALLVHLREATDSSSRNGLWAASACFTGLAMAMKYTNWPLLIVLLVIFAVLRLGWKSMALYAGVALACVLPWIAKNWAFYGNPLFPYLHELWRPDAEYAANWRTLQDNAWGRNWGSIAAGRTASLGGCLAPSLGHQHEGRLGRRLRRSPLFDLSAGLLASQRPDAGIPRSDLGPAGPLAHLVAPHRHAALLHSGVGGLCLSDRRHGPR